MSRGQFIVAPDNENEMYYQSGEKYNPGRHFNIQTIHSESVPEFKATPLPESLHNNPSEWIDRIAGSGELIYEDAIKNNTILKSKLLPHKYDESIASWEILVLFEKGLELKACLRNKISGDLLLVTSTRGEPSGKNTLSVHPGWLTYTVALYAPLSFWKALQNSIKN
jgi:hypothetical protein